MEPDEVSPLATKLRTLADVAGSPTAPPNGYCASQSMSVESGVDRFLDDRDIEPHLLGLGEPTYGPQRETLHGWMFHSDQRRMLCPAQELAENLTARHRIHSRTVDGGVHCAGQALLASGYEDKRFASASASLNHRDLAQFDGTPNALEANLLRCDMRNTRDCVLKSFPA